MLDNLSFTSLNPLPRFFESDWFDEPFINYLSNLGKFVAIGLAHNTFCTHIEGSAPPTYNWILVNESENIYIKYLLIRYVNHTIAK